MQTIELTQSRFGGAASTFAFERAIQTTDRHRSKQRIAPLIAQWEVLITLFKHAFEIPRLLSIEKFPNETEHRTALTGLMNMGEVIWAQTNEGEELDASESGYDKGFISANLNYLRAKYQEWYGVVDKSLIEQDTKTIFDALAEADK